MILKGERIVLVKKVFKICLVLFLLLTLFGCSKSKPEEKNNTLSINQSLLAVNSTTENIVNRLEKFYFTQEKMRQNNNLKENQNKDDKKEKMKLKRDEEKWKGLMNKVEQLFKNWNRYESEKSLPDRQIKSIEKKMNQLTLHIEEKNLLSALFQANQLNLELAKLYKQYYNKELKAVVKEMRTYMRNIIYLSRSGTDNKVLEAENLTQLTEKIVKLEKIVGKKADKEIVTEVQHYLQDLAAVIQSQNKSVIKIKGNLILNRLNQLK